MKLFAVCLLLVACDEYQNSPNANIVRLDEPTDGLAVYHDIRRGVTCYRSIGNTITLSCVPDIWLKPEAGK